MGTKIIDALTAWNCDVTGALERFLGDEELYISCLDIFANDENFKNLKSAIDQHTYDVAFDCAHTLKGVSGNLGLSPLYQSIVEIVEPLRHKDYSNLNSQYENINQLYQKFLSILKENK